MLELPRRCGWIAAKPAYDALAGGEAVADDLFEGVTPNTDAISRYRYRGYMLTSFMAKDSSGTASTSAGRLAAFTEAINGHVWRAG